MTATLVAKDLSGGHDHRTLFSKLSLTVAPGDVVGVQVAKAFGAALREAKAAGAGFAGSAAEFLTEESRDVVAKAPSASRIVAASACTVRGWIRG